MQRKPITIVLFSLVVTMLAACASYKTTLTDAQGRTMTCEASGKSGIVTGLYLRRGFEDCISDAKAQGFRQKEALNTAGAPEKKE